MNRFRNIAVIVVVLGLFTVLSSAQEKTAEPAKPAMSPTARLQAATTAYLENMEGSGIGTDTISTTLDGWGRCKLLDSPKNADLLIQVWSPEEGGGVSVSSSSGTSRVTGRPEESTSSSRDISSGSGTMRLVVRDAKTKLTLFVASQPVKGSFKKTARENNLVDAAQKLVAKFHDRVEPVK